MEEVPNNILKSYDSDGRLARWGFETAESEIKLVVQGVSEFIDGRLRVGKQPIRILSPSANTGKIEAAIKARYGDQVRVIASDIADLSKTDLNPTITHSRADARRLPFKDKTFDIVFDRLGASWYAAKEGNDYGHAAESVKPLWDEYRRVLRDGGLLLLDAHRTSRIPTFLKYSARMLLKRLGVRIRVGLEKSTMDYLLAAIARDPSPYAEDAIFHGWKESGKNEWVCALEKV